MAEDRKRGLTPAEWNDLRREYEAGASEAALSRKFGADRKTIRARRQREAWVPQLSPQVGKAEAAVLHERAQSNVIDMMSRETFKRVEASGTIERMATNLAEILAEQPEIVALATRVTKMYLGLAVGIQPKDDAGKPIKLIAPGSKQTHADVFNSLMAGMGRSVVSGRVVAGLGRDQASDSLLGESATPEPTTVVRKIVTAATEKTA